MPPSETTIADAVQRLEDLGRRGYTVTVCCEPGVPGDVAPVTWTVQAFAPDGREFARPYAAPSFARAIAIAERKIDQGAWNTDLG